VKPIAAKPESAKPGGVIYAALWSIVENDGQQQKRWACDGVPGMRLPTDRVEPVK
jgi:hypothetical protein